MEITLTLGKMKKEMNGKICKMKKENRMKSLSLGLLNYLALILLIFLWPNLYPKISILAQFLYLGFIIVNFIFAGINLSDAIK